MSQIRLLEEYFDRLWPIARGVTGSGYRESISILSELVPFKSYKFPTGEEVIPLSLVPVIAAGRAGDFLHLKAFDTFIDAAAYGSLFNFGDKNPLRAKAF